MTRDATHRRLVDDLLDLLDGSTRPLMAHLVDSGRLSLDDLKEIEDGLRERAGRKPTGDTATSDGGKAEASE